jgi:hypothetical protein
MITATSPATPSMVGATGLDPATMSYIVVLGAQGAAGPRKEQKLTCHLRDARLHLLSA